MNRLLVSLLLRGVWVSLGLCLLLPLHAQVSVYHDHATFLSALNGLSIQTEDYEAYPLGDIPYGSTQGHFTYTFDPTAVQPAVVADGSGGQALGGSPFDVFVGGDSVTLTYQPLTPKEGSLLRAFGADFAYAPSGLDIPADTYRIGIADGNQAGQFAGNLVIPYDNTIGPTGGTFFLGLIAANPSAFTQVSLYSVQTDPTFLVPAYQADNLVFAVPEPGALSVFLLGGLLLGVLLRRR